jgi:hypothetical protein
MRCKMKLQTIKRKLQIKKLNRLMGKKAYVYPLADGMLAYFWALEIDNGWPEQRTVSLKVTNSKWTIWIERLGNAPWKSGTYNATFFQDLTLGLLEARAITESGIPPQRGKL